MEKEVNNWKYTVKEGQKLRRGYTTGTCAAAAAKAAVSMLFRGEEMNEVSVYLPAGIIMDLTLENVSLSSKMASCSVKKDAGDDPDKTQGIYIHASAAERDELGIKVEAGEGIGVVTKPGLQVDVGCAAINPVPMSMITREIKEVLPPGRGARVLLSIPGGAEIAQKTFNPKLGIVGGLSILGTTGIVEPMSDEAMYQTLALEMKMAARNIGDFIVLVPGNYGKEVALNKLYLPEKNVVKMSNFVGFMLDRCLEEGMRKILLIGHAGKLIKVAAGIFHTHSRVSDARFEVFAAHAALHGASPAFVKELSHCCSSEEMVDKLLEAGMNDLFPLLASKVSTRAGEHLSGQAVVGTVLFTLKKGIVGMDQIAKEFLEEYSCQRS